MSGSENHSSFKNQYKCGNKNKFAVAKSGEYSGWTKDITSLWAIQISKLSNECLLCVTERILCDANFMNAQKRIANDSQCFKGIYKILFSFRQEFCLWTHSKNFIAISCKHN